MKACAAAVFGQFECDLITTWSGPTALLPPSLSPQGASQSLPQEDCRHSNLAINGRKIKAL